MHEEDPARPETADHRARHVVLPVGRDETAAQLAGDIRDDVEAQRDRREGDVREPRADALPCRDVAGRGEHMEPHREDRDEHDADDEGRHHRDDGDEARDRTVHPGGAPQRGHRAEGEADDHTDDERERRDGQAHFEAQADERGDVGAVGPAGTEPSVQDATEPVPVLDQEGPVEPPLGLDAVDRLGSRLFAQLDARRAESAQRPKRERHERRDHEDGHEDRDGPGEGGQDPAQRVPRPGHGDPATAGGHAPQRCRRHGVAPSL